MLTVVATILATILARDRDARSRYPGLSQQSGRAYVAVTTGEIEIVNSRAGEAIVIVIAGDVVSARRPLDAP